MAIHAEVKEVLGGVGHERHMLLTFSDLLCSPEYLLRTLVDKIADEYLRNHYAEIEAQIDAKVIAAMVSVEMGARVEKELKQQIETVMARASQAYKLANRAQ
jgi:hypothetical protein